MININFTLLVQLANFLLLLVLLNVLLFKPVLKVLDERDRLVEESSEIRERLDRLADENITEYEGRLHSAKQEAMGIRTVLRTEALAEFRRIVQETKAENACELENARKKTAEQAAQTRISLMSEAEILATGIAEKLVGRKL